MENSDAGDLSPRSREIEFKSPPPWDDSAQITSKVKFICSYGGKIRPRPQDNQLIYLGGDTKIVAVDRGIKFDALLSKLNALCDSENDSFKYQLPGEDLDALISVTNDDDLEHLMYEYDRLCKVSQKPARLRIFNFSAVKRRMTSSELSFSSDEAKSEERFVDGLNAAPNTKITPPTASAPPKTSVADFLFGSEKENAAASNAPLYKPEVEISGQEEKHIQDLQRLRLEEQRGIHESKNDNYLSGGEYYNLPDKFPAPTFQGGVSYWMDNRIPVGGFPAINLNTDQPIYVIPSPVSAYQSQMVRLPRGAAPPQGYFTFPRPPPEIYREHQQLYNLTPPAPPPQMASVYSEGNTGGTGMVAEGGAAYAQIAHDRGLERQVIHTVMGSPLPVPVPVQAPAFAGGMGADLRPAGGVEH